MNVEIDLKGLLMTLLKRVWIIILAAVLCCGLTFLYTVNFVEPQYEARVTMYVNNKSNQEGNAVSSGDLSVAIRLVNTYINIIKSDSVLDKVIAETKVNISQKELSSRISASDLNNTEMFALTVRHGNPETAAVLANAIADIAPAEISAIIQGSSAEIVDRAKTPKSYSTPDYASNCTWGFTVGAGLAALVIALVYILDVRVKSEEDLKDICQVPVQGTIPDVLESVKKSRKKRSWWL